MINDLRVICQLTDVSAHFEHTLDCQFDDKMEITDKKMEFGLKNRENRKGYYLFVAGLWKLRG